MPYKETEEHGTNYEEPPPDVIEGEEEYEVEKVLASRKTGWHKQLQYLLQWKGYAEAQDTWENATDVHAPELIKQFHEQHPSAIKAMSINRA